MKFRLRSLFVLVALLAILVAIFRPKNTIGDHQIPVYSGLQFISSEPYSREFNWEGETGLFHGTRWEYETDHALEDVKEFYETAFPSKTYAIDSNVYRPDYLSIIVNFKSLDAANAGEAFSLSMVGRKVTIEETRTFAPYMKWPERKGSR